MYKQNKFKEITNSYILLIFQRDGISFGYSFGESFMKICNIMAGGFRFIYLAFEFS